MILKEDSTEQKLRGAYYTPLKLAEKMVDFFKQDASIKSILEPSCGDGVFVDALVETQFLTQNRKVTAIEIEKNEAKKVAAKLKNNPNVPGKKVRAPSLREHRRGCKISGDLS